MHENTKKELQEVFRTATALHQQGALVQAAELYQTVLRLQPENANCLHRLGVIAHQLGQHEDAIELIDASLCIDDSKPDVHFNRALCFQALGKLESAGSAYEKAIRLNKNYLAAYENLGVVRQDQGLSAQAIDHFRRALTLNPNSELALRNLATVLLNENRDAEAQHSLEALLELNPFDANGRLKMSQLQMRAEDFAAAWESYEWRFYASDYLDVNTPKATLIPHFSNSSGTHASVIVTAEQGLGDQIMFASCAADLQCDVERVHWQCDSRLVPLFRRSFPGIWFYDDDRFEDQDDADIDATLAAGSLPRLYRNESSRFPGKPYLLPCPNRQAEFAKKIAQLPEGIKIGLAWRGGLDTRSRRSRSIALAQFAKLTAAGHTLISLQYGDHAAEIEAFNSDETSLHQLRDLNLTDDIDGVAAAIAALDLVVSVDNSVAHLAGSLGARVCLLLPVASERRWLRRRADTLWYANTVLFRQEVEATGWQEVIESVCESIDSDDFLETKTICLSAKSSDKDERPIVLQHKRRTARAFMLNDTSNWYHWGCSCTSLGLASLVRDRGFTLDSLTINQTPQAPALIDLDAWNSKTQLDKYRTTNKDIISRVCAADKILINGEGTLHGLSQGAQDLLFLARFCAKELGKSVHLLNHSCYPPDDPDSLALYEDVYRYMDHIVVREGSSAKLSDRHGRRAILGFDCLPLFLQRHPELTSCEKEPYIIIAGSAAFGEGSIEPLAAMVQAMTSNGTRCVFLFGAGAYVSADDLRFGRLLLQACNGELQITHARSEYEWLQTIAHSSALISGRFHHTIAAAFTQTPFLVTPSNSHKISGLTTMLGLQECFVSGQKEFELALKERVPQMVSQARAALLSDDKIEQLRELARLNAGQL